MQQLLYFKQLLDEVEFAGSLSLPLLIYRSAEPVTWLGHGLSAFLIHSSSIPSISADPSPSRTVVYGKCQMFRRLSDTAITSPGSASSSPLPAACLNVVSSDCELRYTGMQCLALLVRYSTSSVSRPMTSAHTNIPVRNDPVHVPHFPKKMIPQLRSNVSTIKCMATAAMGTLARYSLVTILILLHGETDIRS
jgi:hypothetical protein